MTKFSFTKDFFMYKIIMKIILYEKRILMKKNKKWIIPVIIILIIVCLVSVLIISLNLRSKRAISKGNLPQASAEQGNNKSDESQSNEEVAQNDNNANDANANNNNGNSNSENNSGVSTQSDSTLTQAVDTSKWDLTKVDIVYDTANVAVPVPKGYVASGADGEHTVNTGFVIYEGTGEVTNENAWDESCTRNQWVWVPVPDVSRIYETDSSGKKKSKLYSFSDTGRTSYSNSNYEPGVASSYDNEQYFARYGLQGMTQKRFLNELQNEFDETIKSIEKYGGFYIGRYETGNLTSDEPVVQRMNTSIASQNWYTAYTRIKRMSTGTNVRTGMIWGSLWDETLQWLVDSGNKTYAEMKDSTSWGNYTNSTFEYKTNTNGSTTTKSTSSSTRIPSGSTEYSKANNIYDMAGNVFDWTLEGDDYRSRSKRGGVYGGDGSGHPASHRSDVSPDRSSDIYGFRAYFNIE